MPACRYGAAGGGQRRANNTSFLPLSESGWLVAFWHGRRADGFLDELLTDAYGDAEQLTAFEQALRTSLRFPFAASVVGTAVQVASIRFEGGERRGLARE